MMNKTREETHTRTHRHACRRAPRPASVFVWETESHDTYSVWARHVTSAWTVMNQARTGSASIRAVRHVAKTNAHGSTLAHAWPEWRRSCQRRVPAPLPLNAWERKSRAAGVLADLKSKAAAPQAPRGTQQYRPVCDLSGPHRKNK